MLVKNNTLFRASVIVIPDLLKGPLKIVRWAVGRCTEMSEFRVRIFNERLSTFQNRYRLIHLASFSRQNSDIFVTMQAKTALFYAKPDVAIFNIAILIHLKPYSFNPCSFNSIPIVILFNPYSFNLIFRSIQFNFCILLMKFLY